MASRDLWQCHPALQAAWGRVAQAYMARYGGLRGLIITATYRSPEEQWLLFQQGRVQQSNGTWAVEQPAVVVTQLDGRTRVSQHNIQPSRALDFAVLVGGKLTWAASEYEPVGVLGEQQGLVWGGRWLHLRDLPHLQLPEEEVTA